MFWKHRRNRSVIDQSCYNKLSSVQKSDYYATSEEPTHTINDSDNRASDDGDSTSMLDLIGAAIVVESIFLDGSSSSSDNILSSDDISSSSDNSDMSGGGGDFGGGGSGEDY